MTRLLSLGLSFALLILAGTPSRAQPLAINDSTVGAAGSGARAELYLPAGRTPAASVVLLHGCNGVAPHYRIWAARLAQWGYAALLVDSFRPRGFTEVCNHGRLVPAEVQARDAFDAAAYLRSRPELRNVPIGLIGFSHGGWAVLKAVLAGVARRPDEPPFAAAVAFYPACDPPASPLDTDTLILIGDADDWTPSARCERWRDQVQTNGHTVRMKVYPQALHAFDTEAPPHNFAGHYIGRDAPAAQDALAETQAFFAARLMPHR